MITNVGVQAMQRDPRAEPRFGERVPYVVVNGPPGAFFDEILGFRV